MSKCIDIAEVRAKKFTLNMLEEDGSKNLWDFNQSLKVELIKDPNNVFKSMDVLWNCYDAVPSWFWQTWEKYHSSVKSSSLDFRTYSGLMRAIKKDVEGVIDEELYTYASPEYCQNKSMVNWNCWICKHRKNYKDCEGNSLPELFCKEEASKKWNNIPMEDNREFGIRIGRNEDNEIIIDCVYCNTMWNEDRDDYCMVTIDGNPLSPENKEMFKGIKEGMENKEAEWYICPLNCLRKR